jgi:hypothetical protein
MGGSAWCESVEGRGSKFYFSVLVQGTDQKAPVEPYHRATPLVVLVIAPPGSTTDVLVKNLSCMKVRTILSTPNQAGNYASQVSGVILDASYSERAMSFVQKLSAERPDIKVGSCGFLERRLVRGVDAERGGLRLVFRSRIWPN